MTSTSPAPQAPEAAPAAPANPAVTAMVDAPPGSRVSQAADTSGLPTNLDDIEALFAGKGNVEIPNSALETPPATPPPAPQPGPLTPPPAAPLATEPPPAEAPAAETPTEATTEAPSAPEAVTPEKILPNRIPTSNLDTAAQRALKLQHELNDGLKPGDPGFTSLRKAMDILETGTPKPEAAVPRPGPVEIANVQIEAAKAKVTEAKASLTELSKKRAELVEFGQDTAEIDTQIADAHEAVATAAMDARFAERDAQQAAEGLKQNAAEAERQNRIKFQDQAAKNFPSVTDANSPLRQRVDQMAEAMKSPDHPGHAILFAQNAPVVLTQMAANELATEMAATGKATYGEAYASLMAKPAATPPLAQDGQERKILPAAAGQPTTLPPRPPTGEELLAQAGTDPDALDAAFANAPKPFGGGLYLGF